MAAGHAAVAKQALPVKFLGEAVIDDRNSINLSAIAGQKSVVEIVFENCTGISGEFIFSDDIIVDNIVVTDSKGVVCDKYSGESNNDILIFAYSVNGESTSYTVTISYIPSTNADKTEYFMFIGEIFDSYFDGYEQQVYWSVDVIVT